MNTVAAGVLLAMLARIPGKGSQYAIAFADRAGNPFDGARNYRLNIPANVPAKDFWSVVLYDPQKYRALQDWVVRAPDGSFDEAEVSARLAPLIAGR